MLFPLGVVPMEKENFFNDLYVIILGNLQNLSTSKGNTLKTAEY